jgi:hypothetical protein
MSALITVEKTKAILCHGKWMCCDVRLETALQQELDQWVRDTGGPPIGHKDPDGFAAEALCERRGYRFLLTTKTKKRAARDRYFEKRQLELFA